MLKKTTILAFFTAITIVSFAQPAILLDNFATGLSAPVDIVNAGDERLFVVERYGYIKIVQPDGSVNPVNFLDIHTQVESGYQEQGLLGLAFHPNYAENGYFFVHYNDLDGNTVIARFTVSTFDPDVADPTTELEIFTADQPFVNHNGGCLRFGQDGYLYIGLGDGGSAGDPGDRAQNPENKLGKMHRLDIDSGSPYAIPASNPFAVAADTLPEIWAIGYRNPWRFSFDKLTGNMWIGDVGQNLQEEVDVELAGDGGHNYGWRCYEGFDEFNDAGCDDDISTYTMPIFQYPHNFTTGGFSITGGYVYRGSLYPGMYGYYLCADYVSGNWWWVDADGPLPWSYERMDDVATDISVIGEDVNGELYCADLSTGKIYKIQDACGDFVISVTGTDYTCGTLDGAADLSITNGEAPYTIEWSNGAITEDISGLTTGNYTVTVIDNAGCERQKTVFINELPAFDVAVTVAGNTLTADNGISWQWYLDGVLIEGATSSTYDATTSGNYYVVATDINNCSATSESVALTVAINNIFINALKIYPNPTNDELFIQSPLGDHINYDIDLINQLGEIVLQQKTNAELTKILLTTLTDGLYVVKLTANNTVYTQTIVLAR
ncbi:MAG TPA: PQQ-dependent sugar dehydrogenase [Chitinophagales bacterium]|nr:PQQ-dependent sugar dehydrogenase [Chitinophagales bacterium]HRG26914.1 PQQ-dependent sugar dehydrogenase [Chitinophagales bacterium]HRG85087.1 PQQ-dependent sugar dehydrogenase [Chitinophagales bacterium]HRH52773.1 PQQ-dependent sugar dehydrogenase [Chitinophagales bacterium]